MLFHPDMHAKKVNRELKYVGSRHGKKARHKKCSVLSGSLISDPRSRCLAHQLEAGASVAVLARSRSKFDKLIPILKEKELPVEKTHFIAIDLASTDDIRRAAIEANEWAGGCADILVNNGESGRSMPFSGRWRRRWMGVGYSSGCLVSLLCNTGWM